jgi:hypothetical protein
MTTLMKRAKYFLSNGKHLAFPIKSKHHNSNLEHHHSTSNCVTPQFISHLHIQIMFNLPLNVKDDLQAFLRLLVPSALVLRIGLGASCVDLKVGKFIQVGTNYINQIYNQKFNAPNHVLSLGPTI